MGAGCQGVRSRFLPQQALMQDDGVPNFLLRLPWQARKAIGCDRDKLKIGRSRAGLSPFAEMLLRLQAARSWAEPRREG